MFRIKTLLGLSIEWEMMELKDLIEKIMAKSELQEEEVLHNLAMKQKEFGDLIDEHAAAKLIAKELGIPIQEEEEKITYLKIEEIKQTKPPEVSTIARVINIFSPKNFETERKKGKVCNLEISDETSKATLVLWDEDVRWMERSSLERDDILLIRNAQVKTFNPLELHSTLLTEFEILKPQDFANSKFYRPLPQQPARLADSSSLKEGETIDLFARVVQLTEIKEFQKAKGIGKVLNILVSDNEGRQIPVVLWDYAAEYGSKNLNPNDAIKMENAQVKKGLTGLELHLNWPSHLIKEPKNHNLKKEEDLLKELLPTVRILDLKTGGKGIVKAVLSRIDKAEMKNGELFVQAEIHDEINVPVQFSGRRALEILQLRNLPKIPLELALKLKEEYLKGKRVSLVIAKEKDRTGRIAKYNCEHVLHFT